MKVAKAQSPLKQTCEQYRQSVQKYFGEYTDQALFVADKESDCQNIKSHKPNRNGTHDFCIFQINNEPSALDINHCIKRAWDKFKPYKNWSQWYAVCTPSKVAKYENIKCKKG